jgi:hypothetical protein
MKKQNLKKGKSHKAGVTGSPSGGAVKGRLSASFPFSRKSVKTKKKM